MTRTMMWFVVAAASVFALVSCSETLKDPVRVASSTATVDLRGWSFDFKGPVIPDAWNWDPETLWSPQMSDRPPNLPAPILLEAPDHGGTLVKNLFSGPSPRGPRISVATAFTTILVDPGKNYALQIGALPGAHKVWINGILVWESGVVSEDPAAFREGGAGTLVSLQPTLGVIEIVYQVATRDPLVLHTEFYRNWILGPSAPMLRQERQERGWRSIQSGLLFILITAFFLNWLLRRNTKTHFYFSLFIGACLLKIVFNVELVYPIFLDFFSDPGISVLLYLNHMLNFLPFPFFLIFLRHQFPEDVSKLQVRIVVFLTLIMEMWEILPFALLSLGYADAYTFLMKNSWNLPLNVFTILFVLYILERIYSFWQRKRPMGASLFFGTLTLGLLVLIPVLASLFFPVKYTYYLGWGLFLFILFMTFSLIRTEILLGDARERQLRGLVDQLGFLEKFLPRLWLARLGKQEFSEMRPGEHRPAEVIVLQLTVGGDRELWLPSVGAAAGRRNALLVRTGEDYAVWALEGWSEAALALAQEMIRSLKSLNLPQPRLVLAKAFVEYRVLDAGSQWVPDLHSIPDSKLAHLNEEAERLGSSILFDPSLKEGLVVGGWKAHRLPHLQHGFVELFEEDEPGQKELKLQTLPLFHAAQEKYSEGQIAEALETMLKVLQANPLDTAARFWIKSWSPR